jgi:hypothetical protein
MYEPARLVHPGVCVGGCSRVSLVKMEGPLNNSVFSSFCNLDALFLKTH